MQSNLRVGRSFLVLSSLIVLLGGVSEATLFQFEIFTSNGQYYDSPLVDLSVDVTNGEGVAEFTFYNESNVDCSITRIFFDDGVEIGTRILEN